MNARLVALLGLVGLIVAWLCFDELRLRTTQTSNQLNALKFEAQRLQRVGQETGLSQRVEASEKQARDLTKRWFTGETTGAARAQMVSHLQSVLLARQVLTPELKFRRASDAPSGNTATAKSVASNSEAKSPSFEAFSVAGRFSPATFLSLLDELAETDRALIVEGLSIQGARFEIYGKAGLLVANSSGTLRAAPAFTDGPATGQPANRSGAPR